MHIISNTLQAFLLLNKKEKRAYKRMCNLTFFEQLPWYHGRHCMAEWYLFRGSRGPRCGTCLGTLRYINPVNRSPFPRIPTLLMPIFGTTANQVLDLFGLLRK